MRKLLLSIFVIVIFIIYAFIKRNGSLEDISNTPITPSSNPSVNDQNNLLTTSPTESPTFTPTAISVKTTPIITHVVTATPTLPKSMYKNGEYTGDIVDAYYGNVQIKAVIQGSKLSDVQFLDYPHDRNTSVRINTQATPMLTSEAIVAQSANVDIISGATATSEAFIQSLQSALNKAKS